MRTRADRFSVARNSVRFLSVTRGRRSHHRSLPGLPPVQKRLRRVLFANKGPHCGDGHNRSSPAVTSRIQRRHEAAGETRLLRAIIFLPLLTRWYATRWPGRGIRYRSDDSAANEPEKERDGTRAGTVTCSVISGTLSKAGEIR